MNSNYKTNSYKSKKENEEKERKRPEKVVSGKVIKKKNNVRKMTDNFIADDVDNVKSYLFSDVIVPAIKKVITDVITNGLEMILYGDTQRGGNRGNSKVRYTTYSSSHSNRPVRTSYSTRTRYSSDDVIVSSRSEAEEVLRHLDDIIDMYGIARVADLYDLVGERHEYTDNDYGWTNISNAEAVRVRTDDGYGYAIKMPRALPID